MSLSNNLLDKEEDFGFKPFAQQSKQSSQAVQEEDFGFKPFNQPPEQKQQEVSPFEDEGFVERESERGQAQVTSRMLESIAGLPGDVLSFISNITGAEQTKKLPTSKDLREFSEKASLGYTKPKTEFEERGGEIAQDIASLMLPGSQTYSLSRNIGIPLVANLAKEGVKLTGVKEGGQDAAKAAVMIGLDLLTQRRAASGKILGDSGKAYAGKLFEEAKGKLPKGQKIAVSTLSEELENVEKSLQKGGSRPSTQKALEKIKDFKADITNGKIDVQNLYEYRTAINETIDELGGFALGGNKALKEKAVHNLNQVKGKIIKTLEEYGEKVNPEFLKPYKAANEAYAVASKSNLISNFVQKKFGNVMKSDLTKMLFGLGGHAAHAGLTAASPVAGAGVLAGKGIYDAGKVLYRVFKSPTLAKYYGNVLSGALSGNSAQVMKNLHALDKELGKDETSNTPKTSK